jgi:hypothetical protein
MMTKTFCSMALVAALIPFVQSAPAQDYKAKPPKPTIQDYGPFNNVKSPVKSEVAKPSTPPGSGKCGNPASHCLFYGGDFVDNPLGSPFLANGLANETDNLVSAFPYGAAVWSAFTVPNGQTWNVTGLFTNNQSTYGVLDQSPNVPEAVAIWSINEGVVAGSAGTVVASGTNAATSTPTGRSAFGLNEYTIQVTGLSVVLTSGTYWMSVVPVCTNTANPYCNGVFFESDVEYINTTPANAQGPAQPVYAAFFDSPYFGLSFDPTNGEVGACAGEGCDAFSAGVLGYK